MVNVGKGTSPMDAMGKFTTGRKNKLDRRVQHKTSPILMALTRWETARMLFYPKIVTWWFQPIWKILVKHLSCHHLENAWKTTTHPIVEQNIWQAAKLGSKKGLPSSFQLPVFQAVFQISIYRFTSPETVHRHRTWKLWFLIGISFSKGVHFFFHTSFPGCNNPFLPMGVITLPTQTMYD